MQALRKNRAKDEHAARLGVGRDVGFDSSSTEKQAGAALRKLLLHDDGACYASSGGSDLVFETVSTVFNLFKDIPVSLWKAVERPLAKAVVAVRLRRANKKLPSKQELRRLAFGALGGQIDEVIGFRDIPTKRLRIVLLWRESLRSYNCQLLVIEAFGEGIRTLWQSQQDVYLTANARIEVADINCDGKHEIYFVSSSFGSGGGSTQLYCLTPDTNEVSYVSWQHEWTTWKSRPMPTLVSGPNVSAATLALLENMAERLKLNPKAVLDPESAEAAVFRWHRDNADLVSVK